MIFKRKKEADQKTELDTKPDTKKPDSKNLLDPGSLIFLILALGIDLATIVLYVFMFFLAQVFNMAVAAALIGPFIYAIKFIGISFIGLWFFTKSDAGGKAKTAKGLWKFIGAGVGTSTPGIGAFFFLTLLVFSEIIKQ